MKYRIQIQQVFGGNWKSIEEASQHAEWLEKDNIKPRSRAAALEALETQMNLYKNGAPHRVVAYYPDGTFEVLYTLSRGTPFFPAEAEQHPTLADCAAKFEDAPLPDQEIPPAPGCVTCSQDGQIVGRATCELPPGYFEVSLTMRDYKRAAAKGTRLVLQGAEQASLADALEASRLWGGAEIHYVCSETGRQCSAMWTLTPDGRGKYRQNLRSAAYFEFVKGGRKRSALRRKLNKYLERSNGGAKAK